MEERNHKNDGHYLELTDVDKKILDSYKAMVPILGEYLGNGYEIILHSLEDLQHSVIENVNGHYSGRKNGSPITDLALSMLTRIKYDPDFSEFCYMNRSKSGSPLRSTTIPVYGENKRIIGLICINFYTDIPFSQILEKYEPVSSSNQDDLEIRENFSEDVDELIENVVDEVKEKVLGDPSVSPHYKNKKIIEELNSKGIFNIKDSVIKVAALLKISKNTVYMHIRNANSEKES